MFGFLKPGVEAWVMRLVFAQVWGYILYFIGNQFIFCWWKGLYLILFRSFNNTYIRGKIRAKSWKFQSLWPTPVIMNSRLNPTNHSVREQQFKLSENILHGLVIMQYAVIKIILWKYFEHLKNALQIVLCFLFSLYEKCKIFYWKTLEHLTGTRYIFTVVLTIDPSKWGQVGHVLLPVSQSGGRSDKNNINYPELVTVEGWSREVRGSIFSLLWYFSVKTVLEQQGVVAGCGGCNSRLFLSSFIAAGKKNIMRETNFNRKSHFISLFWGLRKSI